MNNCTVAGKYAKTDTAIILHILCHLPEQFEGVVHELSKKLEDDTAACKLKLVCEQIMLRYKRLKDNINDKNNSPFERALLEIPQDFNLDDLDNIALAAFVKG